MGKREKVIQKWRIQIFILKEGYVYTYEMFKSADLYLHYISS